MKEGTDEELIVGDSGPRGCQIPLGIACNTILQSIPPCGVIQQESFPSSVRDPGLCPTFARRYLASFYIFTTSLSGYPTTFVYNYEIHSDVKVTGY